MNRKGTLEWPTFLIKSVFSMLLFLIGVFMVIDIAKSGNINFENNLDYIIFQTEAARILNSASCLAWEESTPDGYLVHAGIVDPNKLSNLNSCLGGKAYSVELNFTAEGRQFAMPVTFGSNFKYNDEFGVKVALNGKLYDGVAYIAVG